MPEYAGHHLAPGVTARRLISALCAAVSPRNFKGFEHGSSAEKRISLIGPPEGSVNRPNLSVVAAELSPAVWWCRSGIRRWGLSPGGFWVTLPESVNRSVHLLPREGSLAFEHLDQSGESPHIGNSELLVCGSRVTTRTHRQA